MFIHKWIYIEYCKIKNDSKHGFKALSGYHGFIIYHNYLKILILVSTYPHDHGQKQGIRSQQDDGLEVDIDIHGLEKKS